MDNLLPHFRALADEQLGWPLALLLAATTAASLWLVLNVVLGRSPGKALRRASVAVLLSLLLAGSNVVRARQHLAEHLLSMRDEPDPSERARNIALAVSRILYTVHFTSWVLAGALFVLFLALLKGQATSHRRRFAAVGALLASLTAAAAGASNAQLITADRCLPDCFNAVLAESQRWAGSGKWCVFGGAALCWLWLLQREHRDSTRANVASWRGTLASTLLLALGAGAFLATRSLHWDANHPIPPDAPNTQTCFMEESHIAGLPPAPTECVASYGMMVEIVPKGALLDSQLAATPEDLREQIQGKRQLWQQLHPGYHIPGVVQFAAPSSASTSQLLPWLTALDESAFVDIAIYVKKPPQLLPTKTLGTLNKQRCCATVVKFDPSASTELTAHRTWGDFIAAASPQRKLALR